MVIDAKKDVHQKPEAEKLIASASFIYAAKGKKIVEVDRKKTDLTDEEILKLVLGPTGNLRAPTLVAGKKMVVGFNEEMYSTLFT